MNRTELAQALAGNYTSKEYNAISLMLNEVTDEQLQSFVAIYRTVNELRG